MSETERLREELAQLAASYIVERGLDRQAARTHALEDLTGSRRAPAALVPSGEEIETAVRAHFALFDPEGHARMLERKRRLALEVLRLFEGLEAYLTGAVLNGSATEDSPVVIEVCTDDVKAVLSCLMDAGLDLEALDPRAAPAGTEESVGFLAVRDGVTESVRVDICAQARRPGGRPRRRPDACQQPWEAAGRIGAENLQKALEKSLTS